MSSVPIPKGFATATPGQVQRVKALVHSKGLRGAAAELGLNSQTIANVLGECPLRRGTIALLDKALSTAPEGK